MNENKNMNENLVWAKKLGAWATMGEEKFTRNFDPNIYNQDLSAIFPLVKNSKLARLFDQMGGHLVTTHLENSEPKLKAFMRFFIDFCVEQNFVPLVQDSIICYIERMLYWFGISNNTATEIEYFLSKMTRPLTRNELRKCLGAAKSVLRTEGILADGVRPDQIENQKEWFRMSKRWMNAWHDLNPPREVVIVEDEDVMAALENENPILPAQEMLAELKQDPLKKELAEKDQEIRALAEELKRKENPSNVPAGQCVVCMSKAVSHILVPCGHLCSCDECVYKLKQCPLCRANITSKVRVFTS